MLKEVERVGLREAGTGQFSSQMTSVKFMSCLSLLTMSGGGGEEPKFDLVIFAKIRGVRMTFDCVFATEVSRSSSECTQGSDWTRAIYAKALCRVQLHFNTIPVKRKGKKWPEHLTEKHLFPVRRFSQWRLHLCCPRLITVLQPQVQLSAGKGRSCAILRKAAQVFSGDQRDGDLCAHHHEIN